MCRLSAWWLYGGANGNLLQEGLCHTQHVPGLLQSEPLSPWQATADLGLLRRHSNTQKQAWLSLCGVSGSQCAKVLFEPSEHLWQVWGLILNVISPFISSCWGFSFALGDGVSLFGGIQHSPVDWYSAASCIFGVLSGEDERVYSVILSRNVCVYLHLWSQSAEYTQDGFIARGVLWFLPDMEGGKNRIEKGRTWA